MTDHEKAQKVRTGFSFEPEVFDVLDSVVRKLKKFDKTLDRSKFLNWFLKKTLLALDTEKVVELYLESRKTGRQQIEPSHGSSSDSFTPEVSQVLDSILEKLRKLRVHADRSDLLDFLVKHSLSEKNEVEIISLYLKYKGEAHVDSSAHVRFLEDLLNPKKMVELYLEKDVLDNLNQTVELAKKLDLDLTVSDVANLVMRYAFERKPPIDIVLSLKKRRKKKRETKLMDTRCWRGNRDLLFCRSHTTH